MAPSTATGSAKMLNSKHKGRAIGQAAGAEVEGFADDHDIGGLSRRTRGLTKSGAMRQFSSRRIGIFFLPPAAASSNARLQKRRNKWVAFVSCYGSGWGGRATFSFALRYVTADGSCFQAN